MLANNQLVIECDVNSGDLDEGTPEFENVRLDCGTELTQYSQWDSCSSICENCGTTDKGVLLLDD